MIQVLQNIDLVLQANTLGTFECELVDDLNSAYLSIAFLSGLLDLTKRATANNYRVQFVVLRKH